MAKTGKGKDTQGVPTEINKLLKEGPKPDRKAEKEKQLRDYYLQYVCTQTKTVLLPLVTQRDSLQKEREDFDKSIRRRLSGTISGSRETALSWCAGSMTNRVTR
jgi:hypothetical protein